MQAIIITAYKNYDQLYNLIELLKGNFFIYVHIDKKSDILYGDIQRLKSEKVYIISRYNISWGSINHLYAILDLIRMALENNATYIHVISGQDYPIKDVKYFNDHFTVEDRGIYISLHYPEDIPRIIKDRYEYFNLFQKFNAKNNMIKCLSLISIKLQKICRIKRLKLGEFTEIYYGAVWISLPSEAAKYTADYARDNPKFMKDLFYCYIPEELFFQTIIMNSDFSQNIIKNSLRYTDWNMRNGSNPAFLDMEDYESISISNCIFARKIHPVISKQLTDEINRTILTTNY